LDNPEFYFREAEGVRKSASHSGAQWRNYRTRPRPRKTQRGGALCPGPKLPVRRTYQALLAKSTNMIFYEVQNRRISVGNVPHDKQSRKPWSACPDCSEDLNEDIKTQPPYVKCPFCGAPIQPIWWQQTIYALLGLFLSVAFPASLGIRSIGLVFAALICEIPALVLTYILVFKTIPPKYVRKRETFITLFSAHH